MSFTPTGMPWSEPGRAFSAFLRASSASKYAQACSDGSRRSMVAMLSSIALIRLHRLPELITSYPVNLQPFTVLAHHFVELILGQSRNLKVIVKCIWSFCIVILCQFKSLLTRE